VAHLIIELGTSRALSSRARASSRVALFAYNPTGEGQVAGEAAGLRGSRLPFGGVWRLPAK
jgi:hypothetical protein